MNSIDLGYFNYYVPNSHERNFYSMRNFKRNNDPLKLIS